MSHLPTLIADLALILVCAGIMTLLFKRLKQPLVLGYVVAGFLASPSMPYTPSVIDIANIQTWADIGVIFLLFALGLEFSFKKIVKAGGTAVIATFTIIFCMILLGEGVGAAFGWKRMDSLFLGGMIAMSSTTIIYKAFDDMGLRKKKFTGLVLSILILEDLLAIVLMVMLSTMAVSNNFEGTEMLESIGKLLFFLVLWFVVGIYLVPLFLRKCRKLMNEETLLIVALGLCFGMVVVASHAGFSSAFGAFIMGSILAETIEAETIDRLVKPVKDLFGAIFFVSVGMMVNPAMIVEYALPIAVITLAVIVGQATFGTLGVVLAGKPLKMAMQCGFSLTQIGEFAFIIASLGVSLHVTSDFLYPVVVAVSVITTFLTPYLIRAAEPASAFVDKHLPASWRRVLDSFSSESPTTLNHESLWRKLLMAMLRITVVYSIVSIAVVVLSFRLLVPFLQESLPGVWASLLGAVVTIVAIAPFLRAIMVKKNHSVEFTTLWDENQANRAPLAFTIAVRIVIAAAFVAFIIAGLFQLAVGFVIGIAVFLVLTMVGSRLLKKQSILIERRFFQNLRSREIRDEYLGQKAPAYAGRLLSHDLHLADVELPAESLWAGKTLLELNLGRKYGVRVASILRGRRRLNIPGGSARLFPLDKLQVIGTDEQLSAFGEAMREGSKIDREAYEKSEMLMKQFLIDDQSVFLGRSIRESGIRDQYHCLVVGMESSGILTTPNVNIPLKEGDVLWIVGEKEAVYQLITQKSEKLPVAQ
ncbi:MAG: cation:proton antiporter [Mediterranea sp.]|jgi:CPA2 family monovalent cation:H+ antiporter-2|nr:cation:proton antiporter [Mediterranea sp.]